MLRKEISSGDSGSTDKKKGKGSDIRDRAKALLKEVDSTVKSAEATVRSRDREKARPRSSCGCG